MLTQYSRPLCNGLTGSILLAFLIHGDTLHINGLETAQIDFVRGIEASDFPDITTSRIVHNRIFEALRRDALESVLGQNTLTRICLIARQKRQAATDRRSRHSLETQQFLSFEKLRIVAKKQIA